MARTRGQFIALWDWKTGVHMMGGTSYKWATESLQGEQASRTTTPPGRPPGRPPRAKKIRTSSASGCTYSVKAEKCKAPQAQSTVTQ